MQTGSSTGQQQRWMAAISVYSDVQKGLKKHPDIAGDNGIGRSCGGFGAKIHLATDGGGMPLNIVLSPRKVHESQFSQGLLDGISVQRQNGSIKLRSNTVLTDEAYSSMLFVTC